MRTAIVSIALAAFAQLSAALPAPDLPAVASSYVADPEHPRYSY